jgi:transposase
VIAGVILYGILKRIRTTRGLEEAIEVRLDVRWLCSGQSIDHTTISMFRFTHKELIKELFVQVALIARQVGQLTLDTLGFDETKIKASS